MAKSFVLISIGSEDEPPAPNGGTRVTNGRFLAPHGDEERIVAGVHQGTPADFLVFAFPFPADAQAFAAAHTLYGAPARVSFGTL